MSNLFMTLYPGAMRFQADWARKEKLRVVNLARIDKEQHRATYAHYLTALDDIEDKYEAAARKMDELVDDPKSTCEDALKVVLDLDEHFRQRAEFGWNDYRTTGIEGGMDGWGTMYDKAKTVTEYLIEKIKEDLQKSN